VGLVGTDVSEEVIIEQLLVTANAAPRELIISTVKMEA
jgi:hypothetical protein